MVKEIFERFKHRHNIIQHIVKEIIRKDLGEQLEYYAENDITKVNLIYPCPDCAKDVHFTYDYDKALLDFKEGEKQKIELTIGPIIFNIYIKGDDIYHTLWNENRNDKYLRYKEDILTDINVIIGKADPSTITTNHMSVVEEFNTATHLMVGSYIKNTCPISLDFHQLKDMFKVLKANFPKRFNITITNI